MKILALCDYQMDYLAEGLLVGLWESGHDIYEMPILQHVRGGVDEGYPLPDGNRGFTGPPGHLLPNVLPNQPHAKEEVFDGVKRKEFDLIIMLSHREHARFALEEIIQNTGVPSNALPLLSCDGEDGDLIDWDLLRQLNIKLHFKRELLRPGIQGRRWSIEDYTENTIPVWPLPFSAFVRNYPEDLDDSIKNIDFFMILGWTHPSRDTLVAHCLEYCVENQLSHYIATNHTSPLLAEKTRHIYADQIKQNWFGWQEYIERQAHARMTAVIRGWGRDSLHVWEAFSFATATLYVDPGLYLPYPFIDEQHCLHIAPDFSNVKSQLFRFHSDPDLTRHIALAGKGHCHEHHTNKKRVEYMIDVAHRYLYGKPATPEEFNIR
jgi:hypothetical protein